MSGSVGGLVMWLRLERVGNVHGTRKEPGQRVRARQSKHLTREPNFWARWGMKASLPPLRRSFDGSFDHAGGVDYIDLLKNMTYDPHVCDPSTNLLPQDT